MVNRRWLIRVIIFELNWSCYSLDILVMYYVYMNISIVLLEHRYLEVAGSQGRTRHVFLDYCYSWLHLRHRKTCRKLEREKAAIQRSFWNPYWRNGEDWDPAYHDCLLSHSRTSRVTRSWRFLRIPVNKHSLILGRKHMYSNYVKIYSNKHKKRKAHRDKYNCNLVSIKKFK